MASDADPLLSARQLHQDGQLAAALERCDALLKSQPRHFDAVYLSGLIALQMGCFELGLERLERALLVEPGNAAAHCNKAVALQHLGRREAALLSGEAAIRSRPDYALALNNRGTVLADLQRWDEALSSYEQALRARPDYVSAHFNRGNALQALQQYEPAVLSYEAALNLNPGHAPAHANRGAALSALNRLPEALASFDAALALKPDLPEAHFGKAITLLLDGQWAAGWKEYEWRPRIAPNHPGPQWRGERSLAGKTLLIHGERGLGDTLQYCRYAKPARDLQATVILQVQEPLVALLRHLEGASRVIGMGEPLPEYDYHCPLLSLPYYFGTELDCVPAAARYLEADPDRIAQWRARLAGLPGVRIGLVWRGDPGNKDDAKRSVPLETLLQALPSHLQYISLQRNVSASERAALAGAGRLAILCDELDFPDTAAVCRCLDLIISVDTSVAHLGGALGCRTWVLLPFNPDCRWLLDRTDSPWYPSVSLYRQPQMQAWPAVLKRIAEELSREFPAPRA